MKEITQKYTFRLSFKGLQEIFAGKIFPYLEKIATIFSPAEAVSSQKVTELERLIAQFDYIETIPVRFDGEIDSLFDYWIEQSKPFIAQGKDLHGELERRVIALQYRLDQSNGGEAIADVSQESFELLRDQAVEWKKTDPLLKFTGMGAKETAHLKVATRYPLFADLIQRHPAIRQRFFQWILRDENDVQPFVQFPATAERLLVCGLSGRISRFGGGALKITKELIPDLNVEQKILTLPFEGKDLSILDTSLRVRFDDGYSLTIQQIFEQFMKKEVEVGNLEFMEKGIVNWNIHHLAIAKGEERLQIDLNQKKWWEAMPIFEILNRRQVWRRYGISLKPRQWVAAACATRGRPNLDYEETHAYLEVAIPRGKGLYAVYDFGKLALKYPETVMEKMSMFTQVVHATVAYPDENVYYSHRQKAFEPFALSPNQGEELMDHLKRDIETSRAMNFIYQIESENCAKWVHHILEETVGKDKMPDLFRMQLLDTQPQGPIALLFRWIKQLPAKWQVPVLAHLHMPLGAFRKTWIWEEGRKVAKSLSSHSFFETGQIYLPALLVEKVMSADSAISLMLRDFKRMHHLKFLQKSLIVLFRLIEKEMRRSKQKSAYMLALPVLCRFSRYRPETVYTG